MKELKYNIKLMISRNEFYLALTGIFGIQLIQVVFYLYLYSSNQFSKDLLYPAIYQTSLLGNTFSFGIIHNTILPVICSLLFSDALLFEKENNYNVYLSFRINKIKDLMCKSIICFLVTFILCLASFGLNYLLCQAVYSHGSYSDIFGSSVYLQVSYPFLLLEGLRLTNLKQYFLCCAVIISAVMGMISVFSLLISPFLKNKTYVYFAAPIGISCLDLVLSTLNLHSLSLMKYTQFPVISTLQQLFIVGTLYVIIIIGLFIYQIYRLKYVEL